MIKLCSTIWHGQNKSISVNHAWQKIQKRMRSPFCSFNINWILYIEISNILRPRCEFSKSEEIAIRLKRARMLRILARIDQSGGAKWANHLYTHTCCMSVQQNIQRRSTKGSVALVLSSQVKDLMLIALAFKYHSLACRWDTANKTIEPTLRQF